MSAAVIGRLNWEIDRDKDGHRTYNVDWLIRTTDYDDGPETILGATGLPAVGAAWSYGNDNDAWALCWPNFSGKPVVTKQKGKYWIVNQMFTTKPLSRCQTDTIEDPLNEPADISGNFVKFVREAVQDKDGNPLNSSSLEMFRGPNVERDDNRPSVKIGLNVATLPLATATPMIDTLNDATLWGLPAGTIKLSNMPWQRKLYGTCSYYYTMNYEFEINYNGWSRFILDEGTRVLCPGGDATNPKHFYKYKDPLGGHGKVLLDGAGNALDDIAAPYVHEFELYDESNFLLLGIPGSF